MVKMEGVTVSTTTAWKIIKISLKKLTYYESMYSLVNTPITEVSMSFVR